MKVSPARFRWAVIIVIVLAVSGCGSNQLPTYPVDGQVVFEDQTAPAFGTIEFYNAEHQINARGKIKRDGTFSISTFADSDGAVAGDHKIVIVQHVASYLTAKVTDEINHDHGELVHPDYFDYRTSNLSCTIKPEPVNQVRLTVRKNPSQTEEGMPKK